MSNMILFGKDVVVIKGIMISIQEESYIIGEIIGTYTYSRRERY